MSELWARLAATAARRPDALALQAGARSLRYRELAALADASVDQFRAEGLGAGAFVGWLGHNTPEMLAALLACTRLGAVFVPLNWRLSAPELARLADHAGLSSLKHQPETAALAAQVVAAMAAAPGHAPAASSALAGDVLLVYTSGTGGQPKGALHTQAGLLANIDIAIDVQGLDERSRVLAALPLFHVGGLCIQTLPALVAGAAVNLQPRFDAAAWLQAVAQWRPDTSLLVPAAMRALVEHAGWQGADLASLRFVNSGSQIVPVELIEAFHARGIPVAQVYGCTESGPFSVALRPLEALQHVGQAGRAAPGVQCRLQGDRGAEVAAGGVDAIGEIGEIMLRAPNLMRAYHRLPEGSGFVDGWFATGDLARADAQGYLTVVGRRSDRIISGGENIDPAEIEQIAAAWPGVAEAAAVGLPDERWGEVPVLAIVPRPGATIDLDALRAAFDGRLARFKQPRRIVVVDALPRTALGKVQRARLAATLGR